MRKLILDYETGCDTDLVEAGRANYCADPSLYIQIASWKIDDGLVETWACHDGPFPVEIFNDSIIYAFNAQFEIAVTRACLGIELPLNRVVDVQALCGRYGLPQNLMNATKAICPEELKDSAGSMLIGMFKRARPHQCVGPYWQDYIKYNRQDVESTAAVLRQLPADRLSDREQSIWELTSRINQRGLPIAVDEAQQILKVTTVYLDEQNKTLPRVTNGAVEKVTQVKRIKDFVNDTMGFELVPDLKKDAIEALMNDADFLTLPDAVVNVIEMRASLGLSSIGKYKRIVNMASNGRMYDNSRYYGAHTGRITGMGFQLLNLPRASVSDPESEIASFFDLSVCEHNPVKSARALIRSMIKAQPGYHIMCADYSSIEYILLIWLAEDWEACQRFADKFDQYKDMASFNYGVPYDEVTKDQRQMGKVGILGCGYGMGARGFVDYAARFGVDLSLPQADAIVKGYRKKYHRVVRLWYKLMDAAQNAVTNQGRAFTAYKTTFRVIKDRAGAKWLQMTLASGRAMYYRDPKLQDGQYGLALTYFGIDQKTKTYVRQYSTPGKLTENVIQALGRDILYDGKFELERHGFNIIGSIYDENICEEKDGSDERLELMLDCMCKGTEWSKDIPLRADGWVGPRYKK